MKGRTQTGCVQKHGVEEDIWAYEGGRTGCWRKMHEKFMICTSHHTISGDEITYEMGKASDKYGGEEKCTLSFGVETWMTWAEKGGFYEDRSST